MIEKRYQHYTKNGVEWTPWFATNIQGTENIISKLNKGAESKWQLKSSKLLNEYRYV